MSNLKVLVTRLFAGNARTKRVSRDPEAMSLREWADLPPHHPL
ncbi:hypothetical protein [Devosia sp. 2618]